MCPFDMLRNLCFVRGSSHNLMQNPLEVWCVVSQPLGSSRWYATGSRTKTGSSWMAISSTLTCRATSKASMATTGYSVSLAATHTQVVGTPSREPRDSWRGKKGTLRERGRQDSWFHAQWPPHWKQVPRLASTARTGADYMRNQVQCQTSFCAILRVESAI